MAPRGDVAFAYLHFLPTTPSVKDGVWVYPEEDEAGILSGLTYINIHTANNQAGEIRGQIELQAPGIGPGGLGVLALALLAPRRESSRAA